MYADGYITQKRKHSNRKIGLSLNIKDMERLEAFKEDLEFTGPINTYTIKQGYKIGSEYGRVLISSEKLAQDLIDKGCVELKTHKLTSPSDEIVPRELKYHFIRGYLDGDGSISVGKENAKDCNISFTGTEEFLNGLKKYLGKSQLRLDKRYKEKNDNIYSLNIGGTMQVIEYCYRFYAHSTTYMKRKYDNYRTIVNEYFKPGRVE